MQKAGFLKTRLIWLNRFSQDKVNLVFIEITTEVLPWNGLNYWGGGRGGLNMFTTPDSVERGGLVVNASDSGSRGWGCEPHSGQTVLCP